MAGRTEGVLHLARSHVWAILPEKLDAILDVLEMRAEGLTFTPEEIEARVGQGMRGAPQARTQGRVAVIPVYGVLSQRMNLMSDMSGGTSTEQLAQAFSAAMNNDEIGAVVLDMESPGGSTAGIPELAAMMRALRGKKPVYAVANTTMASAAYWLAAQADQIIASPSALVGSIGTVMVHTDQSVANEKAGVTRTYIASSPFKAEANSDAPLSSEAAEAIKALVMDHDALFVNDVALGRGITPAAVRANYGKGRVLTATQALEAGLVDKVQSLDELLAQLSGGGGGSRSRPRADTPDLSIAAHVPGGDLVSATSVAAVGGAAVHALVPDIASVAAPVASPPSEIKPAPKAKEHTVSEITTAAPTGADLSATTDEFLELAALTGKSLADVRGWKASGKSVADVRKELVQQVADGHQPIGEPGARTGVTVGATREANKPWESFGHFLQAVRSFEVENVRDPRLGAPQAAASGMSQASPSEGGFTVAPQYAATIWDGLNSGTDSLLGMTDNYTVEGESLTFNANAETSRATGSRYGGMQAYWLNEADTITSTKPKFRQVRVEPQELGVLVYVTDKLLRNSNVALQQYVARAAVEEIDFMVGNAIVNGNGVGQPKGILNSASLVSVTAETQPAASLWQINIAKMWARLHPRSRPGAVWLHNPDIEPQLGQLSTLVKDVAGTQNVGGYTNNIYDPQSRTLYGRPLVACEYCATLGTVGDLILWDPKSYITGTRGGVESALSIHVGFVTAQTAFRFMFAVDGQPWLGSALTPFKGTNTLSTHVALATRS